jgi:hypothetical protein
MDYITLPNVDNQDADSKREDGAYVNQVDDNDDDDNEDNENKTIEDDEEIQDHKGARRRRGRWQVQIDLTPPEKLLDRAERLSVKHKGRAALPHLIRATALCAIIHGPNSWQYARVDARLGSGYLDVGEGYSAQAECHAENARLILESNRNGGTAEELLGCRWIMLWTLGRAQILLNKGATAENTLRRAASILFELEGCSSWAAHEQRESKLVTRANKFGAKQFQMTGFVVSSSDPKIIGSVLELAKKI